MVAVVVIVWLAGAMKACCLLGDGHEMLLVGGAAVVGLAWRAASLFNRIGVALGWWA